MPYSQQTKNAKPAATRTWLRSGGIDRPRKPVHSSAKSGVMARQQQKVPRNSWNNPTNPPPSKHIGHPERPNPGDAQSTQVRRPPPPNKWNVDGGSKSDGKSSNKRSNEDLSISWLKPGKKARLGFRSKSFNADLESVTSVDDGLIEIPIQIEEQKVRRKSITGRGSWQQKLSKGSESGNPKGKLATKKTTERKRTNTKASSVNSASAIKKLNKTQQTKTVRKVTSIKVPNKTKNKLLAASTHRPKSTATVTSSLTRQNSSENIAPNPKRSPNTKPRTVAYDKSSSNKSTGIKQKVKPNASKLSGPSALIPGDLTLRVKCQEQTALIKKLKNTLAHKERLLNKFQGNKRKTESNEESDLLELKKKYDSLQLQFEKQQANINTFKSAIKKRDDAMENLRARGREQETQLRSFQQAYGKRGKFQKAMDRKSPTQIRKLSSLVQNVANGLAEMRNMALEVCEKANEETSADASSSKQSKGDIELKKKQQSKVDELKKKHTERKNSLERLRKQREEMKTQWKQIEDKMESNIREVENLEVLKGAEGKRHNSLKNRIEKLRTRIQTSRSIVTKRGLEKNLQELQRQQSACGKLIQSVNVKLQKKSRELESQRLNSGAYKDQVHALSRKIISVGHGIEKLKASITGTEKLAGPQKSAEVMKEVSNLPTLVQLEKLIGVWEKELQNLVTKFQLLLGKKEAALNKCEKLHQAKIETLEAKMSSLAQEKDATTLNIQQLRKEIQEKTENMQEFKEGMDTTRVNLQLLQMEIKTRDSQIVLLKNEQGVIKGKVQQLQKGIRSRNLELTKLRNQQKTTTAGVEQLRKDIQKKDAEIESLSAQKSELEEAQKSALEKLKNELEKKTAKIAELVKAQSLKKEVINRMKEEADKKEEQIANLTLKLSKSVFSKSGAESDNESMVDGPIYAVPKSPTAEPESPKQYFRLPAIPSTSFESTMEEIEFIDFSGLAQRSFLRIREQRKRIRELEKMEAQLFEKGREKASEMEKLLAHKDNFDAEMGRLRTRYDDLHSLNTALGTEMENIRHKIRAILDRPWKVKEVVESKWYKYPDPSLKENQPLTPVETNVPKVSSSDGKIQEGKSMFSPPMRLPPNIPPPNIYVEDAERQGSRAGDGRVPRKPRRIITISDEDVRQ